MGSVCDINMQWLAAVIMELLFFFLKKKRCIFVWGWHVFSSTKEAIMEAPRPRLKPVFQRRHINGWWRRRQPVFRTDGGSKLQLSVHRLRRCWARSSHHLTLGCTDRLLHLSCSVLDDPAYTHRCFLPLVDSWAWALWEITLSLSYLVPQAIFAAWLHTCDISLKNKTGSYLRFMGRQTLKYLTTLCRQNNCFQVQGGCV